MLLSLFLAAAKAYRQMSQCCNTLKRWARWAQYCHEPISTQVRIFSCPAKALNGDEQISCAICHLCHMSRIKESKREKGEQIGVLLSIIIVQHFLEVAAWEKKWDPATDSFWKHFVLMSSLSNLADKRPRKRLCHSSLQPCSTLTIYIITIWQWIKCVKLCVTQFSDVMGR